MIRTALAFLEAHPVASHCVIALGLMAIVGVGLRLVRNPHWAWYAHAYASLFYFARESAQAERAVRPALGPTAAFWLTLWPGSWGVGGARLWEWLAPALLTFAVAALIHLRPGGHGAFPPRRRQL